MPEQSNNADVSQQNQSSTTDQTSQADAQQQPTQTGENSAAANPSARTGEQFEKLLNHNRELFEKYQRAEAEKQRLEQEFAGRQATSQSQQMVDRINQATTPAPQYQPNQQNFTQQQMQALTSQQVDPTQFIEVDADGQKYVNEIKLKAALDSANQRAANVENTMKEYIESQQRERELIETQEAYKAFPELNPNTEKKDSMLIDMTEKFLLDSMINKDKYGGVRLTFSQAAQEAKKYVDAIRAREQAENNSTQETEQQVQQRQEQAQQAENVKQQASAETRGNTQSAQSQLSAGEHDELVRKTRAGRGDESIWALAQRLQNISHSGTPRSQE